MMIFLRSGPAMTGADSAIGAGFVCCHERFLDGTPKSSSEEELRIHPSTVEPSVEAPPRIEETRMVT
jgi:hypothetical protein